jgi:hypothetical protein
MEGFEICSGKRHTPSGESWDTLYWSLVLLLPLLLGTRGRYAVMALGSLDSCYLFGFTALTNFSTNNVRDFG